MQPINQDQNESSAKPFLWVVLALTMYGIYYFTNGLVWERMPIGDSTNTFLVYSYQYSGFARGEFPLWNPLNRTGEPLYFINVLYLANPIFNLNIGLSLLLGITNIYLSYLIFNFIIIVSYVTGIYLLVLTLTRNHHSSALAAILTLGSGLVAYNMHGNTVLFWIHNVPWIFYGLINYSQKFQFRFLAVVILGFTSALYAYEIVYPLSFIFLALIATMIFYRKSFNLVMLKKISAQHIILVACLALVSCLPMLIIIYKTMGGNYLPPSTRMDLSSLNISEDLRITWDLSFSRLDEFFLICENCWSAMFTGAFWGKYQVARYYIGPVAFPFLILAFLSRNKTVFCIGFTGLLTSLLAGNFFPANLIYHLPFFEWMRYGTNFNMFIQIIVIILSAIGFNFFIKHPFSIGKTTLVRVNVYMLGGYAFLAIVLPGNSLVDSALSLSAVTTISLMVLAYCKDSLPKRLLPHLIIFITLVTVFSFQYLWVKHNPLLKGWKITNQEVLSTKNRVDHSLNFSMERPDSLRTLDEDLSHISTTAFYDEYYSLLSLKDNTYNIKLISRGGFGSVPLFKDFFIFLSIPNKELLLKKKFFYFDKVLLPKDPNYLSTLIKEPGLLKSMLQKNTGVVDAPGNPNHPAYRGEFSPEKIKSFKKNSPNSLSSIDVTQFKANSINLNVTTSEPGLFVYTDSWDEGWHAKVNGKPVPVLRAFHSYKGIELGKGLNKIEFYFQNNVLIALIAMNIHYFCLLTALVLFCLRESWRGASRTT